MTSYERLIRTLAQVPWPRAGSLSAAALLLSQYDSSMTWGALVRLYSGMTALVMLPLLAEALHMRIRLTLQRKNP